MTVPDRAGKRFARVPFSVLQRLDISPTAKLIYGLLMAQWHMNGEQPFRIGLKKIAQCVGVSERTVSGGLTELRGGPRKGSDRGQLPESDVQCQPLIRTSSTGRSNKFEILQLAPSSNSEGACHAGSGEADEQNRGGPHKRDVPIEHEYMTPRSEDLGGVLSSTASEEKIILRGRELLQSETGRWLLESVRELGYHYDHDIPKIQSENRRLLHYRIGSSDFGLTELEEIIDRVMANQSIKTSEAALFRSLLETGIGDFSSPLR
jgi:hypothetical protein